jgi:UPF0271 protein
MLLDLDAGEHASEPEELWALADILAVACGGHAGDATSMQRLAAFCAAHGRGLGAHPSYPDREGFGRRTIDIELDALRTGLEEQCTALAAVASAAGATVRWVKVHGALYHDAAKDSAIADVVVAAAIASLGSHVTIIGPPEGQLAAAARAAGLAYLREGFADRAIRPDGSLVPRSEPGALITDPTIAAARARELAGRVDTICVHADTPQSLAVARAVREAIDA